MRNASFFETTPTASCGHSLGPYGRWFRQGSRLVVAPSRGYASARRFNHELTGEFGEGEVNRSSQDYTRWVQQSLNRILGLQLVADGHAGEKTRNAIRTFQTQRGLPPDGLLGARTEAALIAAGAIPTRTINMPPLDIVGSTAKPAIQEGDPRIIDLTSRADKSRRFSTRDPKKVWALVLHQMACCFKVRDPLTRFLKMAPHFAILPDGRILQLHPILSLTGASNGFNPGSVAVEFAGNFPDTRGRWWNGAENGQNQVTLAQIEAGRYLVKYLKRVMGLREILAHRQSSGTRENDPGPDIWYHVGQWAIDNLGLTDGGPGFKTGSGNPIPDLWRKWGQAKPQPELEFSAYEFEVGEREVNRGSSAYVRWVQQALNRILGVQLVVDGDAGVKTRSAVRSFQTQRGLVADGIVGSKTEAALVAAGAGPAPGASGSSATASACAPNIYVDCPVSETINTELAAAVRGNSGVTRPDVIDGRIDVFAQYSLLRMFKGDAAARADGEGMLAAVKSGQLAGIYKEDERVPAMRARNMNLGWWQLIPKGEDATLVVTPQDPANVAPIIVFRDSIRSTPARIDPALRKAWRSFLSKKTVLAPDVCKLTIAHPIDVPPATDLRFVRTAQTPPVRLQQDAASEQALIQRAFRASRRTLQLARNALNNLLAGFRLERQGRPLNPFQKRVLISVGRWLKVDTTNNSVARVQATAVITRAIRLIDRNLAVKTSAGTDPPLRRVNQGFHSEVNLNSPDLGIRLGNPFFTTDGPNCHRDLITHEFFHLIGVQHGGSPLSDPTNRGNITTPDLALDSADNLAQLVSEIMNGKTDACTRNND